MTPIRTLSRREMLQRVGAGLGTIGLASVLADDASAAPLDPLALRQPHFAPKAKHIIHLFMEGGPSQVDTFDPKPELTKHHGTRPAAANFETERATFNLMKSDFKFSKCGKSGVEVSEIFPEVGKCIDDICVIRSMHTEVPNHEPGLLMMNCGHNQPIRPSMGSWLCYGLGNINRNLPGYVVLFGAAVVGQANWSNSFLPGIYQGCLIRDLDPRRALPNSRNAFVSSPSQRRQLDLLQSMNALHRDARGSDADLDARIQSLEVAFHMQTEAAEVFDLAREPRNVRSEYGSGKFADACLTARRLVERGVRMVQVYDGGWDTHAQNGPNHRRLAGGVDRPIAALLRDLKRTGLLDETIVLWSGEFGRTPTTESGSGGEGRDHNHLGFTVWMAGGGVKGGLAYGATDEFGFKAVENRVHVHDLHATMLHLMGLDHEKLTYRYSGRDFRLTDVHGHVIREILA